MIFIIGLGRSGTSLLQSILNAHSEIAFLPETHFLRKYVFTNKLNNKPENYIVNILELDNDFKRANIKAGNLFSENKRTTSKELFDKLGNLYLTKKNKKIIGDKDPRNLDYIKKLFSLYPQAKFIHIKRDPRDIIVSRLKADWSSSLPFIFHPLIINAQYKNALKNIKWLGVNSLTEVNYEDLITNTEKEIKNLCRFLGVAFEKEMLNYTASSKELVAKSEMQWKKETFKPINKSNYNKWKKELSNNQIFISQIICKDIFNNTNYKKENINIGLLIRLLRPFFYLLSCIVSFIYPVRIFLNK